ncbi:MAG: PSD1 domain-containing protein [Planctomycetes bacterium]|nr:PSD1 domain-containing protein [Planctomycetota bacterium]
MRSKCLAWRRSRVGWLIVLLVLSEAQGGVGVADEPQAPLFEHQVLPILRAHCFKCHGLEGRKAGLDLRTVALMLRGGEHGAVLVKGDSAKSLLFQKTSTRAMPPGDEKKLSDAQIQAIKGWIKAGAVTSARDGPVTEAEAPRVAEQDRQFWAFCKPTRPGLLQVRHVERMRTGVDTFVLTKLEAKGLNFLPDAERLTLMRRAYFDLIGLPPSPEEVDAYLADEAPNAYERLIDRLLASPHFGERWGRHWLDVAGYADTLGSDNDAGIIRMAEGKWQYRDYVVRSFNSDKSFDRFLTEQLAGDELVDWRSAEKFTPETLDLLVATGFLRNAPDTTTEPELNTAVTRYQVLNDTIQIVTSSLLGLTVQCARCHSHKYDPIPQLDYYRLTAIFTPALNPQDWQPPPERALPDVSPAEKGAIDQHNAEIERQVAELTRQPAELRRPYETKLAAAKLDAIPEPIRADTKAAIETPADKRTEIQKYLASKFEASLKLKPEEVTAALSEADKAVATKIEQQVATLNSQKRSFGRIQALADVGPPLPTYLLRRGDYEMPGLVVDPGFLSVLCATNPPLPSGERDRGEGLESNVDRPLLATPPTAPTSRRRLEFAHWLTKPDTPAAGLVARVMVNRIWHHLFGQGIVTTLDNFGKNGARPTHPELLDWLAVDLMESGWRVKPFIKLIMTSTVYRQASASHLSPPGKGAGGEGSPVHAQPDSVTVDPDNTLLWRQRLRRLESEVIRDSILATSGKLDQTIGGPPIPIEARPDGMVVVADKGLPSPTSPYRRSLYLLARRNYQPTILSVFDQPVLATNCPLRTYSAVSLQSLTMLNDAFVLEQAGHFAHRVAAVAGPATDQRIELAFRIALARRSTAPEYQWGSDLLQRQTDRYLKQKPPGLSSEQAADKALANLCQMLLNTNEFLYVE